MQITGSTFIVTGGASGLGEATARSLVYAGGNVAIFDVNDENGQALVQEMEENALYCHVDVTDQDSVQNGVQETLQRFASVWGLVNCAGIGIPAKVLSKQGPMSLDTFQKILGVNLVGTFNMTRLVAAQMANNNPNAEGERGVIVNTASVAAFEGQVGQVPYAASKAGIVGMTLPLAREFAALGIRVVSIAPGLFDTPMFGALPDNVRESLQEQLPFPPRFGKPEEFAHLVGAIAGNPVLNGETIRLDSAMRMQPR
ncbi:MAG: 3-hydroxyacyl-CoA dehydrogenase [Desulfohalobiaceae bacterium]